MQHDYNQIHQSIQGDWHNRQLSTLGTQYDLIPCYYAKTKPGEKQKYSHAPFANGETYPIGHPFWDRAAKDCIAIRLNKNVLVDRDGYKDNAISVKDTAVLLSKTDQGLTRDRVQWEVGRDSEHYFFKMPDGINPDDYKDSNDGKSVKTLDIKTGNQLCYIKYGKENCFDKFKPLDAPRRILAALKREGKSSTHTNSNHTLDAEAVRIINLIDPDCGYDEWKDVIAGTVDQFGHGEDVINTLDQWSSKSDKYPGRDEIAAKVSSFTQGGGITWGTVKHLAGVTRAQVIPISAAEAFKGYSMPDAPPTGRVHIPMMIDHHGYETKQTKAGTFPAKTRHNLEKVLDRLGIVIAINSMTQDMDVLRGDSYEETKYEVLYSELVDHCERTGLPLATIDLHLKATAFKRSYHPVEKALHGKTWDGVDRVSPVLDCMPCENPAFRDVVMRKWLISAMAAIYAQKFFTKLVPVIKGVQTSFKTSFLQRMCSIAMGSFASGQTLDTHDPDSVRSAVSKHIIELGEMESTTKKDMGSLKSFITRINDAFRVPYDKSETIKPRQTVFIGSVNVDNFLRDATGNDRFPVIELTGRVDIDRANEILGYSYSGSQERLENPECLIQFWLQVRHWYESGERWDLTTEELEWSASINSKYAACGPYYLAIEDTLGTHTWTCGAKRTAGEVCSLIGARVAEDARVRVDLDHLVRDGKLIKKRNTRGWVFSLP